MLRLLSLIFLLAGAGIAALGGWLFMGNELPDGLLGKSDIVLERKMLEPTNVAEEAEISEIVEAPVTASPPPPAPEPEPIVEMAPVEPVTIEPVEITSPKKSTTSKTRSLSVPAELPSEPEQVPQEPVVAMDAVVMPEAVEAVAEPIFTTTSTVVMPVPEAPSPTIEEQLFSVPIAYETPASASFNQSFTVTLAINAQEGAETATGGLSGTTGTNVEEAVIDVTDQVKANLFGDAFAIDMKSPDVQKLSTSTESRWRWEVTPTKSGPQDLTFEIFAIHEGNASELVRTFDDTVTVEVSRIGQAMFLAQQYNPIVVILAGFGSLLAGLFGVLRFFRGS